MAAPAVSIHICRCPAGPALTMLMIGTADIIHGYHHVPRAVSTLCCLWLSEAKSPEGSSDIAGKCQG